MNLTYLRYVVEVEKTGSITGAAQNLYMGQPNLSKAIKELEKDIGITLFKRSAKGVIPTKQGVRFLAYAKSILAQMDELEKLYKPQEHEDFEMSISVSRASYLAFAFCDFIQKLDKPALSVHYREGSSIDVFNDLRNGISGIGIVRYELIQEDYFDYLLHEYNLESQTLREFKKRLLMGKDHPLAEYDVVPFSMLRDYTEIIHGDFELPSLSTTREQSEGMHPTAKRIYIYELGGQFALLESVPGTFFWASPVSPEVLERHKLVQRDCSHSKYTTKDVLVYPKNRVLTEEEELFVETVREQYRYFPVEDKLFFKK